MENDLSGNGYNKERSLKVDEHSIANIYYLLLRTYIYNIVQIYS